MSEHPGEHICLWCSMMRERGHVIGDEYVVLPNPHRTCENNTCCVPGCQVTCECLHAMAENTSRPQA